MRDIGGPAVAELGVPISFTARIALKLLQRSDPLSLLVKNYEERQDDMMKDQRKIFRDQMAYLHRDSCGPPTNTKGQPKGKGKNKSTDHQSGKRGRASDPHDPWDREVR
jgi:hypothetical protein